MYSLCSVFSTKLGNVEHSHVTKLKLPSLLTMEPLGSPSNKSNIRLIVSITLICFLPLSFMRTWNENSNVFPLSAYRSMTAEGACRIAIEGDSAPSTPTMIGYGSDNSVSKYSFTRSRKSIQTPTFHQRLLCILL